MKTFLLALTMLVLFGGAFAPKASAHGYYRRSYYGYGDPYYCDYRPVYYHRVYYGDPYCGYPYYYHRHYYHRPRVAFFFGF